jgi:thiol:disulfide interchange protein
MTRRQLTQTWAALAVVALAATLAPAQPKPNPDHAELRRAVLDVSALRPGDKAMLAVELEIKPHFHAQSRTPVDPLAIKFDLTLDEHPGLKFGEPVFPAGEDKEYPKLGKLNVYTGTVVVRVPVAVAADAALGDAKITGKLQYQVCDDNVCYPPAWPKFAVPTAVVAAGTPVTPNETDLFEQAAKKPVASARITIFGRDLTGDAYLLAFGAAFVVGIIFNVMPCVLPVVPLKAMGFYEVSQHNRRKSLALGAVFSLGLVASFGVLALLIVVLRALDWGQLFTNPWFRALIIGILLAMAVSTFGLFTVNLPTGVYRFTPRHDTYVGNFLFGIFTALLSTPCTFGMFVGLLTWALTQPAVIGVTLIMMVGVGMAFPYLVLSAFPELARRFPRTGPWAEIVKQLMGFLLLGTAVFFAKPFIDRAVSEDVFWWALFGVVALAAVFLVVQSFRHARTVAPRLVATAVALLLLVPSFLAARQLTYHPHAWRPYTDAALAEGLAAGQITLVEFTADWCGNCKFLEATVLNNRGVAEYLKSQQTVMVKADMTHADAPGRFLLKELNPVGSIPLTAVYSPKLEGPIVLNGLYSRQDLKDAIARAATGDGTAVATR